MLKDINHTKTSSVTLINMTRAKNIVRLVKSLCNILRVTTTKYCKGQWLEVDNTLKGANMKI